MNKAALQISRKGKFYPFCSNRCKLIDLGKWLDADYKIPVVEIDEKSTDNETKRDRN